MAELIQLQHSNIIAVEYEIDGREGLGARRQVLTGDENYVALANRELNTAILVKYNADDLILP